MRIATFNLESLDDAPSDRIRFEDRLEPLRSRLKRLEADILCLQEVNAQHLRGTRHGRFMRALDSLLASTRYQAFYRVTSCAAGGDTPLPVHNLVILTRFPVVEMRQF